MNIRLLSLTATLALVATPAFASEPSASQAQKEEHFEAQITVTAKIDYLLFLPQGYENSEQR
ncbi:MAG: hypothetical protein NT154_19925 [Verrucomicrobia bacterium]|nr:hypothetical protein [Verrucomicrobiota bacterium]